MMIFNLDRYIVSSLRMNNPKTVTGVRKRTRAFLSTFGMVAPRLLLAIVLSLVITKPLEMRFYEGEIAEQLSKEKSERIANRQQGVEGEFRDLATHKEDLRNLKDALLKREKELTDERESVIQEVAGASGVGLSGRKGEGINFERRQEKVTELAAQLKNLQERSRPDIERLEQLVASQEAAKEQRRNDVAAEENLRGGLAAKVAAIHNLGMDDKTYLVISLFITFMFVLLETAPIFVKLLSKYGPYDLIFDQEEALAIAIVTQRSELKIEIEKILNDQLKEKMRNTNNDQIRAYTAEIMRDRYSDWRQGNTTERQKNYKAKGVGQR
jgi:hypothetical protein